MKILLGVGGWLLLIGVVIFWFLGKSIYSGKEARVEFTNRSDSIIESVSISIHDTKCSATNLLANATLKCVFKNLSDGSYHIELKPEDKDLIVEDFGYVTSGMNFDDKLSYNNNSKIEFGTMDLK